MRNRSVVVTLVLLAAVALSVAFGQSGTQSSQRKSPAAPSAKPAAASSSAATVSTVTFTSNTWAFGGPEGTLYKGAGVQTIIGKPHKLGTQEDEGGYQLIPAPDADRGKPFDHRHLSGVWELIAASNISETVSSWVPPLTAKGKQMFDQTRPGFGPRAKGRDQNDGDSICDPVGWPRITFQPIRPVEFFTLPDRMLQHWAWRDQWRTIWTDGRKLPTDPDPLWYGYAVGRWEGNNFHEVTTGEDERTWLNVYGSVHSLTMVVDAIWDRLDHNTLRMDLKIHDPEIYTQDWVSSPFIYQLFPELDVDALPCAGSEEIFYRDQMRNNYPTDDQVHTQIKSSEPTKVVPPVDLPNTGVGLSRPQ